MTSSTSNNYVQLYLEDNLTLAKTMVMKSKLAAAAINSQLTLQYGEGIVDPSNPSSWKYFLNLAGRYHPTDVQMNVISLDTGETILFSVENLAQHTATALEYRYGTRFYHRLAQEFPEQVGLINHILVPVKDIPAAIAAEEGTILAYRTDLVEQYETTLIAELQERCKTYLHRWNVEAFALSDDLYPVMQKSTLAAVIYPWILNLREKRIKTPEVHSFHLREYLASHHQLDKYLPYLTREQAIWVYRNIKYLERNAGKMNNFYKLLENILNKRNIPLSEYTVRQLSSFDQQGYPIVQARRKQISSASPSSNQEFIALDALFAKEQETTYGNARYMAVNREAVVAKLQTSRSAILQTKDLESDMLDLSNSVPDPFPEVLMRQWVAMTHEGLYDVVVRLQDPLTGVEYSLYSKDAIIYMFYLLAKAHKVEFDVMPPINNVKYLLNPAPTVADLKNFLEPHMLELVGVPEKLLANRPQVVRCTSVSMFNELSYKIYEECLKQWFLMSDTQDLYARGAVEKMILRMYGAKLRDFSDGENIEAWRVRNNLPAFNRSYQEALDLVTVIFSQATGFAIDNTNQIRYVQKALLDMFQQLSSYGIQIIREITDGEVIETGIPQIRVGDVRQITDNQVNVRFSEYVLDSWERPSTTIQVESQLDEGVEVINDVVQDKVDVEIAPTAVLSEEIPQEFVVRSKAFDVKSTVTVTVNGQEVELEDATAESMLTTEQIANLKFL